MIALIAESKTMCAGERTFASESVVSHTPVGREYAAEIMAAIASMPLSDIVATTKLSIPMAAHLHQMAFNFQDSSTGLPAMEAFTGVVFKALDYASLSQSDKDWMVYKVAVISSLYGWLQPDDIIKPYRLDYKMPLAPDGSQLASFWRERVTIRLIKTLEQFGETEIIDLLPGEAARCIDWKQVAEVARVLKVDFRQSDGTTLRTPHAGRLKTLRGLLLRDIVTHRISSSTRLAELESDTFMPAPELATKGTIAFIV